MEVKLRRDIAENGYALGAFASIPAPAVVENLALAGVDFVVIDTEHGESNFESVVNMARAAMARGITALVRVTSLDVKLIGRYLDNGLHGVQVPMVETREEAEMAVRACRFAPDGDRGLSAGRGSWWGNIPNYVPTANREVMCVCMCETKAGVENIEEIVSVPGLDVVFVGTGDLSQSLGLTGQFDHPEVQSAVERVLRACKAANVIPGIVTGRREDAVRYIKMGFQYVTILNDMMFLNASVKKLVASIEEEL